MYPKRRYPPARQSGSHASAQRMSVNLLAIQSIKVGIQLIENKNKKLLIQTKQALEALTRQLQPDSTLHLMIRRIHQFMLTQVTNPCPDNISTRTSKADKRHHGWGLKNVRKIVQKYHGSLEYKVENHSFVVTAMLFFD